MPRFFAEQFRSARPLQTAVPLRIFGAGTRLLFFGGSLATPDRKRKRRFKTKCLS
jgi:hypothetical protein